MNAPQLSGAVLWVDDTLDGPGRGGTAEDQQAVSWAPRTYLSVERGPIPAGVPRRAMPRTGSAADPSAGCTGGKLIAPIGHRGRRLGRDRLGLALGSGVLGSRGEVGRGTGPGVGARPMADVVPGWGSRLRVTDIGRARGSGRVWYRWASSPGPAAGGAQGCCFTWNIVSKSPAERRKAA